MIKNPHTIRRPGFDPWIGKIPWKRAWQPTLPQELSPGESPWTGEPGGLQSIGWQRLRRGWVTDTFTFFHEMLKIFGHLFDYS